MGKEQDVLLDGLDIGAYTRDFVCTKADGDLMVRECIYRKFLTKPLTIKLLDASRSYWLWYLRKCVIICGRNCPNFKG